MPNPLDPNNVAATAVEFVSFYHDILRQIQQMYAVGTPGGKERAIKLYRQYHYWLHLADTQADKWLKENIPLMLQYGDDHGFLSLKSLGFLTVDDSFTQLHEQAIAGVIATVKQEMNKVTAQLDRSLLSFVRRVQLATPEQRAVLEEIAISVALGNDTAITSKRIQQRIVAKAIGGYIQVGNKTLPLNKYADLLARTHLRVAYSRGTEMRLQANNVQLVVISEHNTTCKMCKYIEGKVFSLDGKHPDYPSIKILPNGGCPIHPHCLHVENGFIVALASEEELQRVKIDPATWPFKDTKDKLIKRAA